MRGHGYWTVLVDDNNAMGRFTNIRDAREAVRRLRERGFRVRNPHPIRLHTSLSTLAVEDARRSA